jgi:long-chain fatty acid transport protein
VLAAWAPASRRGILFAAVALPLALAWPRESAGAGLDFSDRGVRPLGRGGAFVAGADDLGAIWYNPAGLADAGTSLLLDASWMHYTTDVTRRTQVTATDGTVSVVESPRVSGTTPFIPIPTIAGSFAFGAEKQFTIAAGAFSPYSPIASYPMTVGDPAQPSPVRYSLVSLDGSTLVVTGGWFAYRPVKQLSIGVGAEVLLGGFQSTVVFSACPADRLVCAAEQPQYDALSEVKAGPIVAPSGNAGIIYAPDERVRIGLSGQLPFVIDTPAKVTVKLPDTVEFDGAYQQGNDARMHFTVPAVLRAGVEVRPLPELRAELAYVREFWSSHTSIDVVPQNIQIYGIAGFPSPFGVSSITLPRNFRDSNSIRLGGEYRLGQVTLRAGLAYEQSAVPTPYLSALTVDLDKITTALGAGFAVGDHLRLDVLYAHVFGIDTTVPPDQAAVPRVNPVQGNATPTEAINGGSYSARADVLGIGMNYRF